MSDRLSIIIYSCWKNRDMWEVFSKLFKKYWSNCPYKIILVTDTYHETEKCYIFNKIVQIDDTWAKMMKEAIKEAETPYVSLWMDDYLLCDYVQNDDIERQGIWGKEKNIGYYKWGTAYSLSTQIGIWNSSFLTKNIKDEWSAWDFERVASLENAGGGYVVLCYADSCGA